jgi:alcohol dehydrogenase YqhD (iron-dependent ADH family)
MVEVGETVEEETKVMEVVRSSGRDAIAAVGGRSVVSGGEEAWGDRDLEAWQ